MTDTKANIRSAFRRMSDAARESRTLLDLTSARIRYSNRREVAASITDPIFLAVEESMTVAEYNVWLDDYSDIR